MYGSETWVLRSQDRKQIQASKMRFLRLALGVALRDSMRSKDTQEHLETENRAETPDTNKETGRNM
jgi:hypothetical protein